MTILELNFKTEIIKTAKLKTEKDELVFTGENQKRTSLMIDEKVMNTLNIGLMEKNPGDS